MNLTQDEVRMLAKLERDMDSGAQPFVRLNGQRLAVSSDDLAHFGLEHGQTITETLHIEILKRRVAECKEKLGGDSWPDRIDG